MADTQAYADPTPEDLAARYPAFSAVGNAVLTYWINDSARFVDQSWTAADYGPARLAAAAHNMVRAGVADIAGGTEAGLAASGVTQFRSGSFSAQISETAIKQASGGGWESTSYGLEYLALLARNKGGPMVTTPGAIGCNDGYNGFAGPLGYPARLFQ